MYDKINIQSGVQTVVEWTNAFGVNPSADGLEFLPPAAPGEVMPGTLRIPERLHDWLIGLRLLRGVPLAYLVPDESLLPVESIRFFNIDATWVDRVVDGVFAAGNIGTVDLTFKYTILRMARERLDEDLKKLAPGWTPAQGLTGMLIRSELVRRWPDMVVAAPPLTVLRAEPISKDVFIAVFAGRPTLVTVKEPNVGIRYGVEPRNLQSQQGPYKVDRRNADGVVNPASDLNLTFSTKRVIDIAAMTGDPGVGASPRMVALHLEQRPYMQEFKETRPESRGSEVAPPTLTLRKGLVALTSLHARATSLAALEGNNG
jgi:hypothetical protein